MIVVHVCRKPIAEGNVAANVLLHGTGALNVDACRVGYASEVDVALARPGTTPETPNGNELTHGAMVRAPYTQPSGRWPANFVLGHLPGCVQSGTRKVKGVGPGTGGGFKEGKFSGQVGLGAYTGTTFRGFADEDGMETLMVWTCAPGCPVASVDVQGGLDDAGGASRFFFQVKP